MKPEMHLPLQFLADYSNSSCQCVVYNLCVPVTSSKKPASPRNASTITYFNFFVTVSVNTVIIFVTFATPKMWIQQLDLKDGYDSLTQEVKKATNFS